MKRKILSVLFSIIFILSIVTSNMITYATGDTVLDPIDDLKGHNALEWTVQGVSSTASLQAFVTGWYFKFTSGSKEITVYVPKDMSNWSSAATTNIFPLTDNWNSSLNPAKGIQGNNSIEDFIGEDYKTYYESIITNPTGCQIEANARIQKYTYDSTKPIGQQYIPTDYNNATNFASSRTEIDNNFKEFPLAFRDNTKSQFYEIKFALPPEKSYTNILKVQYWENTTNGIVRRADISENDTVITKLSAYTINYSPVASLPTGYTIKSMRFQYDSNMPTASGWNNYSTWNKKITLPYSEPNKTGYLNLLIEKPTPPPSGTGNIYVTYLDYDTNSVIGNDSVFGILFNKAQTVSKSDTIVDYDYKGSYQTFATTTPDKSKMVAATSQTVTLTSTNKDAYVYFWYKTKPVVVVPDCQLTATLYDTTVRAGEYLNVFGNTNDTKGHTITGYYWNAYGVDDSLFNRNMAKLLYMTPGIYDISLNLVCAANNLALGTAKITVTEPIPRASINITGINKENRKITIDGSGSSAPEKFPMDWTKTTWKIEPVTSTTAKWEFGLKLQDGTVKIINQSTDQSFLKGQTKFDFQARYAGQYSVKLTVTNSKNLSSTTTNIITVTPDIAPIADFEGDTYVLRNQPNPLGSTYPTFGKATIYDKSTSPDGDTIIKRIWGYRYNSNNNYDVTGIPNFLDETTINKSKSTDAFIVGQRLVVDSENDLNMEIWSYDVGKYAYELTVVEDIPESETIRELLLDSDYKRGYKKEW